MKNIMFKTKLMVDVLQKETLDVSGAIISMKSTLEILKFIKDDSDNQNNMLEAALEFAKKQDVNGEEEFNRVHRLRRRPIRLGINPDLDTEEVTLYSYYTKEMVAVLDMMISVLNTKCENLKSSFKPFYDVLDPSVDLKYYEKKEFSDALQALSKTYPHEINDTKTFENELQVFNTHFSNYVQNHPEVPKDIRSAAEQALYFYRKNNLFPNVAKVFKLFLTAPPSVCKSERSFSRLKILKSCLRSRMNEKRLHYLMLLACEKDLTDQLDLQNIVDRWKHIKTRRIHV